jgi:hypothetical protein
MFNNSDDQNTSTQQNRPAIGKGVRIFIICFLVLLVTFIVLVQINQSDDDAQPAYSVTHESSKVKVKGHKRKDGAYVKPHTRKKPKKKNSR